MTGEEVLNCVLMISALGKVTLCVVVVREGGNEVRFL